CERIDLCDVDAGLREEAARDAASSFIWRPFDVSTGPLFRALIVTLSPTDHVIALVVHHFVADALSVGILGRDFLSAYRLRAGLSSQVPEVVPAVQYSAFLASMNEWLAGPAAVVHLRYWRECLEEAPRVMLKPPAPRSVSESREARVCVEIPADLASAIHKVALEICVTPFVLLLSAQYVMLARWCGLDDITIGTVTHGRDEPALQGVVGYLADRVYYRASLAGNPDFVEVVQRVMAALRAAARHQWVPSDIVKRI